MGSLMKSEPPAEFNAFLIDVRPSEHPDVWNRTSPSEYFLWTVLVALSENDPPRRGRVYYTQTAIARAAQRHRSTVARGLRALESKRIIRRVRTQHGGPYIEILKGIRHHKEDE